jgi:DNA-binding transcriptional LysR family regulator
MRYDLTDLSLFLHIAETGSITAGAERTHIALASASARVRGMESTLGVPLLMRQRRGVQPTSAGWALAHHARVVIGQMERMRGELGEYARGLKGHIRLLSNTSALIEFLPEPLAAFLAAHPNIDVDLEERESTEIVQAIARGAGDVGVIADSVASGGLDTFAFRPDRLVLVTARNHQLAARRRIAFVDALDHDFVGVAAQSALPKHLEGHAARAGKRLKYRVRLRSFEGVCRMVEAGVGIGVIPETAAARCAKSMRIHRVQLTDAWATRQLMLCVRRFDELPQYAQKMIAMLRA